LEIILAENAASREDAVVCLLFRRKFPLWCFFVRKECAWTSSGGSQMAKITHDDSVTRTNGPRWVIRNKLLQF
jgi:hypothetical protein